MPSLVFWIAGFLGGWCLCAMALTGQSDGRRKYFRHGFTLLVIIPIGIGAGYVAYAEWADWRTAFDIEDALIGRRFFGVIAAALAGVLCRLYKGEVFTALSAITDVALKSDRPAQTGKSADDKPKAPAIVSNEDPEKNAASSVSPGEPGRNPQTLTQQPGAVANADPNRPSTAPAQDTSPDGSRRTVANIDKSLPWFIQAGLFGAILILIVLAFNPGLLKNLTSLKAGSLEVHFSGSTVAVQGGQISVLDANRKSTVANWAHFTFPNSDDPRAATYPGKDGVRSERMNQARDLFASHLTPIFKSWNRLDVAGKQFSEETATRIRHVVSRLADKIRADLRDSKDKPSSAGPAALEQEMREVLANLCKELEPPEKECGVEAPAVKATPPERRQKRASAKREQRKSHLTSESLKDPYVIQAVGDLLMLTLDRRHREDFLYEVWKDRDHDTTSCPSCAGDLSLRYAIVDAQVQSERPWPFEDLFKQIDDLLADVTRAIDRNRGSKPANAEPTKLDALLHRNRLIDLTVGLQFFYQRAINGQRFTLMQLHTWDNWLKEVRDVLSLVDHAGSPSPLALIADEKSSWLKARDDIDSEPAITQDAALAAALGTVLQPQQAGSVSSADCLTARSLIDFASRDKFQPLFGDLHFDADDKATYQGFAERIKDRIESECGSYAN